MNVFRSLVRTLQQLRAPTGQKAAPAEGAPATAREPRAGRAFGLDRFSDGFETLHDGVRWAARVLSSGRGAPRGGDGFEAAPKPPVNLTGLEPVVPTPKLDLAPAAPEPDAGFVASLDDLPLELLAQAQATAPEAPLVDAPPAPATAAPAPDEPAPA